MAQAPQSLKNHVRLDPPFHFFLAPGALLIVIGTLAELVRNPGWTSGAHVLVAIWAFVAVFLLRVYPLKVQDRVIRLEEQIRLSQVLPASLQGRIGELNERQLVGLRFASDQELPGLVQQTLDGKWSAKQIKQAIRTWRPDYWRV
jgi:hypothetical protein